MRSSGLLDGLTLCALLDDDASGLELRHVQHRKMLHMLRATPQGWTVVDRPLWEGGLTARARIRPLPAREGRPKGMVALERQRVTHFGVGR